MFNQHLDMIYRIRFIERNVIIFISFYYIHPLLQGTHKEKIPQPFTLSWDKNHFHIYLLLSLNNEFE